MEASKDVWYCACGGKFLQETELVRDDSGDPNVTHKYMQKCDQCGERQWRGFHHGNQRAHITIELLDGKIMGVTAYKDKEKALEATHKSLKQHFGTRNLKEKEEAYDKQLGYSEGLKEYYQYEVEIEE